MRFSRTRSAMRGIAFFRESVRRRRRARARREEEIGDRQDVAQQTDALLDERSDLQHLRRVLSRRLDERAAARRPVRRRAWCGSCSALSQTALASKGSSSVKLTTALLRLTPSKEKACDQFFARHLLAVVLGRPAEQAEEIHEGVRQKTGIAIGGDGNHGAVDALGKLGCRRARRAAADARTAAARNRRRGRSGCA